MPWKDQNKPSPWGQPPPDEPDPPSEPTPSSAEEPPPRRGSPSSWTPRRPPPYRPGGGRSTGELLRELQTRFQRFLRGPDGGPVRPRAIWTLAGGLVGLWLLSGVFMVQPDQAAVITTFGKLSRTETPGLRYHLPYPIERAEKVSVTALKRLDMGGADDSEERPESLMLTGDENIVGLDFSVTWRVSDPAAFLFNLRAPEDAVKDVAESAMREVVGKTPLQQVLTTGRGTVQLQTADLMQRILDSYDVGVRIVEVQIRSANPPREVIQAFRDVANAGQDAESAANEANAYRNRKINEAKGDAAKLIQSAQGYREQAVREAEGDAARFNSLYQEYRRAPAVTRQRLYIETMQRVLSRSNKVVIDAKGASAPLVLPPDVFRARGGGQGGQPTVVQPQGSQ